MYKKKNNSFARSELVDAAVYNNLKTEIYHSFSDEDISVLKHHGILGMKWGVRRYQNEDGTLTEEGKRRYHEYVDDKGKTRYQKRSKAGIKYYDELQQWEKRKSEIKNEFKDKPLSEYKDNEEREYANSRIRNIAWETYSFESSKSHKDLENMLNDMVDEYDSRLKENDDRDNRRETWHYIEDKYRPKMLSIYEDMQKEVIDNLENHGVDTKKVYGKQSYPGRFYELKEEPNTTKREHESIATDTFDELIDDVGIASPKMWLAWIDGYWNYGISPN